MHHKLTLFLLLPSLLLSQKKNWTQAEIDSFDRNINVTHQNVEEYRNMLLTNTNLKGWSRYYATMALKKYTEGANTIANSFADSALNNPRDPKFSNTVNERSAMLANYVKSLIARANEDFGESTKYMLRALEVEKKYPYKYKSYFRATIANNHVSLGNSEKAVEYYLLNLADTAYTNLAQPHVVTLSRIGLLYTANYLNKLDSATMYLKKAERISIDTGYRDNLPFIYSYLGGIHRESNKDSAYHYFKLSQQHFITYSEIPNISPKTFVYEQEINNAFILLYEGSNEEVISKLSPKLRELQDFVPNKMTRDIILNGYDYVITAAQRLNRHKTESEFLKKKISFLEKQHEQELLSEMEKITVAYETKEKEEQINQLRLENENKNLAVSRKKYQLVVISISSGVLVLFIALFFRNRLIKNKFQKALLEQQLLRSQMNPHFIFNIMQSIAILIDETPKKAKQFIVEFGSLLRLYLENSREEFVILQDEIEALEKYMNIYSKMVKQFHFEIKVDSSINPKHITVPPMLIQPLVENAIKHGIAPLSDKMGHIKIALRPINKTILECKVVDNGVGFISSEKSMKSMAMKIVNERLNIYGGAGKRKKIQVNEERHPNHGFTTVSINLPYSA